MNACNGVVERCRVTANPAAAVDVRWNAGRCHGHADGAVSGQPAAVDSDDAVRETTATLRQPTAHRGHLQVPTVNCCLSQYYTTRVYWPLFQDSLVVTRKVKLVWI